MTKKLTVIEKDIPRFLSLEVTDNTTLKEASTYLVSAKKDYKALKADMDTLLDPIKQSLDRIKEKYDPRLKALKAVIDSLNDKTSEYQTALVNSQHEAKMKLTAKVESGYLRPDTAIDKMSALPTIETTVTTEAGGMSFVEYPMCEVEDISQVPIEYHEVDMVRVRAEMKKGNKLPGIHYFTKQIPKNSRS